MKLTLKVLAEEQEFRCGIVKDIPDMFREAFEPANVTDDPLFCIAGEGIAEERYANIVMKVREDAAKVLTKEIAEQLVAYMSQADTFNGYPKWNHSEDKRSRHERN